MTDDLDELEAIARAAQESFRGDESVRWYNGGWDEECVSPDVVLRLIERCRKAEDERADALRECVRLHQRLEDR
jgi:hypothetical protein